MDDSTEEFEGARSGSDSDRDSDRDSGSDSDDLGLLGFRRHTQDDAKHGAPDQLRQGGGRAAGGHGLYPGLTRAQAALLRAIAQPGTLQCLRSPLRTTTTASWMLLH